MVSFVLQSRTYSFLNIRSRPSVRKPNPEVGLGTVQRLVQFQPEIDGHEKYTTSCHDRLLRSQFLILGFLIFVS